MEASALSNRLRGPVAAESWVGDLGIMASNESPETPAAREEVVFRQLDDEWVLYDPSANKLHVLNLTAALVWTHLNGKTASLDIAEAIREAFESSDLPGDVVSDVEVAISRFRAEGLLA
jgi:hypothetical protein